MPTTLPETVAEENQNWNHPIIVTLVARGRGSAAHRDQAEGVRPRERPATSPGLFGRTLGDHLQLRLLREPESHRAIQRQVSVPCSAAKS